MVKRRSNQMQAIQQEPTNRQIEAFASAADGEQEVNLDPYAKRDFKEIRLPLNEFEFKLLDEKAKQAGRSRLNFIRWAVTQIEVS